MLHILACCLLLFQPLAEVLDALCRYMRGGEVGGRCVSEDEVSEMGGASQIGTEEWISNVDESA